MRIVIRKPEWPNKVFHSKRLRAIVAAVLKNRKPAKKRPGVSKRIPVALYWDCPMPSKGTVTARGKDGSGKSKWFRRVVAASGLAVAA